MSIVSNPLIGKTRKSMGNATFSIWKGINVLKDKAVTVANPNTDAQQQQRSAFRQMVTAFRQQPAAIRAGFKKLAVKKSEYNAFMSANIPSAFDMSVAGIATLVPGDVITGKGTIASTVIATVTADRSANTIVVTFATGATQPGQSVSDVAVISAYDTNENSWTGGVTSAARSTGTASIAMPAGWNTGDSLQVYLTFSNPLSGESSDSDTTTATIVA